MANFEYKNIDEILGTNLPIRGIRVTLEDNNLLDKKPIVPSVDPPPSPTDPFEFHTFLPNGAYVSSLYNLESWKIDGNALSLDVHRDMRATKNLPGTYKIVYNFLKNLVGGYNNPTKLFISDISTDRTELKLSLVNPDSVDGVEQLKNFVLSYLRPTPSFPTIVLNFGENKIVSVINVAPNVSFNGKVNSVFVKLYEALPADLDIFFQCWIDEELLKPYIDTLNYIMEEVIIPPNKLRGPNFEVENDYWLSTETDYKSWNDILSANVQTSQEILDRYVSSSNLPVQLNVDFREFENFVFYSSAEDRINNFTYKMELIERYNNELTILDTYTGSINSNKVKIKNLRDKTISGFDNFEKWLYYETTGSNYYTYQSASTITPYPKYEVTSSDYNIATKEGKYKFYTANSSQVTNWYNNLVDLATDYDLKNYNALNKATPEYLREDSDNDQFTTFVNMVGHHFDVIYQYTDHILKKNKREENPKSGMSQDLIFEATRNLGWTLSHGTQAKDLWEYALGVSGSGDPIWTGKTTINKYLSKTQEEKTKEVWRRILNNLPYIYKSKGTSRGIKAILGAYGIPQTLLTIREFGGPDNADLGVIPRAEWEKHTYYLNFSGSNPLPTRQHYVRVPWEKVNNESNTWQYPDTLTFRWKMEPNKLYSYGNDQVQTLLQKNSGSRVDWFVAMNKNGTDVEKGSIYFYIGDGTNYATASITDEYFYDDVPLNLMIRRSSTNDLTSSNQVYDLIVKTNKFGKIAVERSASVVVSGSLSGSYNRAWSSDGQLFVGSGSNSQTNKILSGSIFELRYWTKQLSTSSFDNHVLSARAYNGNTETSSFYDLQGQWKFWQKFNVAVTTSLGSSHPDQTKSTFYSSSKMAYFHNFDSGAFESIVETYNMEVATLGNNTPFTEKVRIDSGSLIGGLNPDTTSEVSAFDRYSVDSNKLMVAFSPQSVINEDIYEALGGVALDDYIGDYSSISTNEYKHLKWLSREYWKKYPNKNDFNSYLDLISVFDFSVFDQIRQTLPARANPILGVVIEPNILERSKVGGIGRNISGESNNVFSSNELSSSAAPRMDYISKATSIQMIGFDVTEGEVAEDIQGEYDIPNKTIKTTPPEKKVGSITGSIVRPVIDYRNTETLVVIEKPSPIGDYIKKETQIGVEKPSPVLVYTHKEGSVGLDRPSPIINYTKNESVIKPEAPATIAEFIKKESSILVEQSSPVLVYTNKEGSVMVKTIEPSLDYSTKEGVIPKQEVDLISTFNGKESTINTVSDDRMSSVLNTINVNMENKIQGAMFTTAGEYNGFQNYANLEIEQTTTYVRQNVYKTTSTSDIGYGIGWSTLSNQTSKQISVMNVIETVRNDNFYNSFYLYYSSSRDMASNNFYSSSLTSSKTRNQESLSLGLQNHRFRGSKLIGPDINVDTRNSPDNKPVVEVNNVGSTQIIYNTYFDRGNLIAK